MSGPRPAAICFDQKHMPATADGGIVDFTMLRYAVKDGGAVITYDRAERRNAWGLAMYREIVRAVEAANADDAVGAIVFTHDGPIYCAGTDFKDGPHEKDPVTGIRPTMAQEGMALDTSWLHLMARSKPTIAAVAGAAIGVGVTQLLPMDIRVGGTSSTYSFPFLRLGFMPEFGCTALLPRLVGYGRAVDICLTAAQLDAEEALRIGLITHLVADDAVLAKAMALGARIAGFPRLQVRLTRDLFAANALETDTNAFLKRESDAFVAMFRAAKAARMAASQPQ